MRIRSVLLLVLAASVLACGRAPSPVNTNPPSPPPVGQPSEPDPNPTPPPNPDPNPTPPPPTPDTTAPTVASSSPEHNARSVAINANVLVTFSEPMNPGSVQVSITPSVNLGGATWKSENTAVQFDPSADLAGDTEYTLSVTGKDVAGNTLSGSGTVKFRTATVKDTTAPGQPQNLNAEAGEGQVKLTWSANTEADLKGYTLYYGTDAGNLTGNTFISKPGSSKTVTGLANGTKYLFQLVAEDAAGNKSNRSSTVNATPKDVTAPKVVSIVPANGAKNVLPGTAITITFNEPMQTDSFVGAGSSCSADPDDGVCELDPGKWKDDKTYVFPINSKNTHNTYSVRLEGAKDKAGNIGPKVEVGFTVADVRKPNVATAAPADNAVGQENNTVISLFFTEAMDVASVQSAFKASIGASGPVIAGTLIAKNPKAFEFYPSNPIPYGSSVVWTVGTGAKDAAGNPLSTAFSRVFRVLQQGVLELTATPQLSGYIGRNCDYRGSTKVRCDDTANKASSIQFGDLDRQVVNANPLTVRFRSLRGFLSFDIGKLPPTVTRISAASLTISLYKTHGNPFGRLNSLQLERVYYGPTLNGSEGDYDVPALECTTGPCSGAYFSPPAGPGDVSPLVREDWLHRGEQGSRSQFRFRYEVETNGDTNDDYLEYHWANTTEPSVQPKLSITYLYP